jgi:predicted kinase
MVQEQSNLVRLNRDHFRQMLFGMPILDSQGEAMVTAAQHGAADNALKAGFDVIVDDTNFFERGVKALMKIAQKYDATVEFIDFTHVSVEECLRRDDIRRQEGNSNLSSAVGEKVIRGMHDRYIKGRKLPLPKPETPEYELVPYNANTSLPSAVIVDIDGTVAKMVDRSPYDWKRVGEDNPVYEVLDMVRALERAGHRILFTSGRDGSCFAETATWLNTHYTGSNWSLEMREANDNRPDWIIKAEIFDNWYRDSYNVFMVIDDRDQVVRMWRKLGLTVAQVAEGNF